MQNGASLMASVLSTGQSELLDSWLQQQTKGGFRRGGQSDPQQLLIQGRTFIEELSRALNSGSATLQGEGWGSVRDFLSDLSRSRALAGSTPTETAVFVFSMKEPIFRALGARVGSDAGRLADEIWSATQVIDSLGLFTMEAFQKSREEIIQRQQRELLELSTPVVQLWSRVLALPLIGTLDSERTQIVMERLLEAITTHGAEIAIIDISGVPTVDTLVAQHLIKTVSAARLMGADCVISGIRPQIAQTIVHLGLDLNVTSKATMADAFALALRRTGQSITGAVARAV